jgi:FkbM family methyltransferase
VKQVGDMWIPDNDPYFEQMFEKTGDKFDHENYLTALKHVPEYRRGIALDVGAHVGSWTRQMAADFLAVHAFEPVAENYLCLHKNTKEFPNVTLHGFGLSSFEKEVFFEPGPHNSGQFHILAHLPADRHLPPKTTTSDVMPLDKVYEISDLHLNGLDFLKVDVEGHEVHVLKGAEKTIMKYKPVILIEQNGLAAKYYGLKDSAAKDFLLTLGMKLVDTVNKDLIFAW